MIRNVARVLFGCMLLMQFVLQGCAMRSAPAVNYFSLLSMEQLGESQVIGSHPEISIGIGPVTIPDSLKRSQIATRQHGNQYTFDEFNRWAGVLEKDFTAIMGNNLGMLLGVQKIDYFPWMQHFTPDYRVLIDIQRLDGVLGGEVVLEVRWSVADASGKKLLVGGRDVFKRNTTKPGYVGLVETESYLVAELCKKVAGEIRQLMNKQ